MGKAHFIFGLEVLHHLTHFKLSVDTVYLRNFFDKFVTVPFSETAKNKDFID